MRLTVQSYTLGVCPTVSTNAYSQLTEYRAAGLICVGSFKKCYLLVTELLHICLWIILH